MKKRIIIIASIICLSLTGCSNRTDSQNTPETTMDSNISTEEIKKAEQYDIKETITDHVTVNAKMVIPNRSYAAYSTKLKSFDAEKTAEMFWPGSSKDEMQINDLDGGGTVITCQDGEVGLEGGSMIYQKSNDISYLSNLASYGEEKKLCKEKNLSFMKEEAIKNVDAFLSNLELGADPGEREVSALSKEDMMSIQNVMKKDADYKAFFESGKFQERSFDTDDEFYRIQYSFIKDGLQVFGSADPTVQMSGGVDQPLLAFPMCADFIVSSSGISEATLQGMVDPADAKTGNQDIIRFDGIKKALINKFGEVIMSDDYNLSKYGWNIFQKESLALLKMWNYYLSGAVNLRLTVMQILIMHFVLMHIPGKKYHEKSVCSRNETGGKYWMDYQYSGDMFFHLFRFME